MVNSYFNMPYMNVPAFADGSSFMMPPVFGAFGNNFGTYTNSSEKSPEGETWEELIARATKELEKDKTEDAKKRAEKELSKEDKYILKKQIRKFDMQELEEAEGSLAGTMAFTSLFAVPTAKKAINNKKYDKTIKMFYKDGGAHMGLFKDNPELMLNAQENMQKLERKFLKDVKAAKGNSNALQKIADERRYFRNLMQDALKSNDAKKIAEATERCKVAVNVKNGGLFGFLKRNKNIKINSRLDACTAAETAGKFSSVKVPNAGKSFLKNLVSSKMALAMTAGMALIPLLSDWSNIKKAGEADAKAKQGGKDTHYQSTQIKQTGIKGLASALTYFVCDTGARTIAKRCLGKFAAKLAAKLAMKGGCKLLGTALGSVVPGIGNLAGLLLGTAADFLLNKYVFNKMDFFKLPGAKQGELAQASDEEIKENLKEKYMMGAKLNPKVLAVIEKYYDSDTFNEMKRVHNMSEKERNEYIAEQQALLQQQEQEQQEQMLQQMQQMQQQGAEQPTLA